MEYYISRSDCIIASGKIGMLEPLEIFFGDANQAAARVYARLESTILPAGCTLRGRVVGPTCEYSQTLSASIPFLAKRSILSPDNPAPLLAEAILPDPCFWSGELPFLYHAQLELRRADEVLATEERRFGIRPLGAQARRLVLEGRTWVVRAADARELPEPALPAWRATDLAMQIERPSEALCAEASRLGVTLLAEIAGNRESLASELKRLSRWPAVAMTVLRVEGPLDKSIRQVARNMLLGEHFGPGDDRAPSDWAEVVVCEDPSVDRLATRAAAFSLPVLARRCTGRHDDLSGARRECDCLQRDLAGGGAFAGYLV
jgi:hypothetical protein